MRIVSVCLFGLISVGATLAAAFWYPALGALLLLLSLPFWLISS